MYSKNMVTEKLDAMPTIMESVLFTNLSGELVGSAKASAFIEILKFAPTSDKYTLKNQSDFEKAKAEIINQIRYN